eukprot:1466761-Amphidinium_carterae.1
MLTTGTSTALLGNALVVSLRSDTMSAPAAVGEVCKVVLSRVWQPVPLHTFGVLSVQVLVRFVILLHWEGVVKAHSPRQAPAHLRRRPSCAW